MYSLIVACAIVLGSIVLGRTLLMRANYRTIGAGESIAIGGGLGLGILSYAVLGFGLLGWLHRVAVCGLLASALLIGYRGILATMSDVRRIMKQLAGWRPAQWQAVALVFIAGFFVLSLFGALAPPTEADAMLYHLAVPAVYVEAQRVIDVPYNFYSYLPFGIHMLYTMSLVLDSSGIAAALVHYGFGALTVLAIYVMGKRYFSSTVGTWGALLFLSAPVTLQQMSVPMVDLGPTLYFTLATLALLRFRESRAMRWIFLAGVFAGLTIGAKLQPIFLVVALGAVFMVVCLVKRQALWIERMRPVVAFALTAILVGSPWYIKNWWNTGNPVYPRLYGVFGGTHWSPELALMHDQSFVNRASGYGLLTFLKTPWLILTHPGHINSINIGYAAFAFVPFAFALRSRRNLWWVAAAVVCIYYVLWFFFIFQRQRHFIYVLPLLMVLAAAGLNWLLLESSIQLWARHAVRSLVVVCLISFGGMAFIYQRRAIPVALGLESRAAYLERFGYFQGSINWINSNLPPRSRILTFGPFLPFYLDGDHLFGDPYMQGYIDYVQMESSEDLLWRLQEEGVTHLLFIDDHESILPWADQLLSDLRRSEHARVIRSFVYDQPESRTLGTRYTTYVGDIIVLDPEPG